MTEARGWRIMNSLRRVLHAHPVSTATTEAIGVVDERTIIRIIELAMRIGDAMLSVGASAHEVTLAVKRVGWAYGLKTLQANVTYNSITASYHRGEDDWPTTFMRVVQVAVPDHSKLQRLQALVADIERGMDLGEARGTFRAIRRTPFLYRPVVVMLSRALMAAGVAVMFGASAMIIACSFLAAFCAALTQAALAKTRVPLFFSQIAGGFAVTVVALTVAALGAAGVELFVGLRPSIIVSSGIMMMLAGLAVVGSVQDAIDGFSLTAGGRILDLTMQTLGVVIGILIGLELGRVLGFNMVLPSDQPSFGIPLEQLAGALIVSAAVALFNGAGLLTVVVSGVLSVIAMLGFMVADTAQLHVAVASGVGALCASFVGVFLAHRLHVPSIAVTTAAIIPLVPGAAVFRGLLGIVESDGTADMLLLGGDSLVLAAMVGIALATGASLGLNLGTPVHATLNSVVKARAGVRR